MRHQWLLTAVAVFTKKIKNVIDEDYFRNYMTAFDIQSYLRKEN